MPGRGPFKDTASWPEPDRTLWARGISPAGRLRDTGHSARWRPATVSKVGRAYSTWLNFLRETDQLSDRENPSTRITAERLNAYRAYLEKLVGPVTIRSQFTDIARALSALAPGCEFPGVKAIARCYPKTGDPLKKRAQLQDPARLLQLGLDLMHEIEAREVATTHGAVVFRDGLMIALLAYRAPRLRNLTSIEMEKRLRKADDGWIIAFEAAEMKNHKARVTSWPTALHPYLETYLKIYRPVLLEGRLDEGFLWIAKGRGQLTENSIYYAVTNRTRAAFGKSVSPHRFRDAAATSIAIHDPENVRTGHHVLGNKFATSQAHYNQASSVEASDNLNEAMQKLRARRRHSRKS